MKFISKIVMLFIATSLILTSCKKDQALPSYSDGVAPVLSASSTTLALKESDTANKVLTLSWTSPMYSIADANTIKYVLQIDTTSNFSSSSITYNYIGNRADSFLGKKLNQTLVDFGLQYNTAYNVYARVTSSHQNNNELKYSNVVKMVITPFKVTPKVALPSSGNLYLVGGATAGGWSNPVPVPAQQFWRQDENTFVGVFNLSGNNEYLLLPVNGDWSQKYAITNKYASGAADGGDFQYYTSGGDNFPSPSTGGWYVITVDFLRGKYTVTPYTGQQVATDLFIVGGATPGGWGNPVPVPSQQFTRLNCCEFELSSLALTSGEYLLLPVNGSWSEKYAVDDNTVAGTDITGPFKYFTSGGQNMKSPATAGNYKINVNFATGKYKLTKL